LMCPAGNYCDSDNICSPPAPSFCSGIAELTTNLTTNGNKNRMNYAKDKSLTA